MRGSYVVRERRERRTYNWRDDAPEEVLPRVRCVMLLGRMVNQVVHYRKK
jgi:hypothetical protein